MKHCFQNFIDFKVSKQAFKIYKKYIPLKVHYQRVGEEYFVPTTKFFRFIAAFLWYRAFDLEGIKRSFLKAISEKKIAVYIFVLKIVCFYLTFIWTWKSRTVKTNIYSNFLVCYPSIFMSTVFFFKKTLSFRFVTF